MLQTAAHRPAQLKTLRQPPRLAYPARTRVHPLFLLAEKSGTIDGCIGTLIAGCEEPALLMVERLVEDGKVAETWVVTAMTATTLRLEEMVAESRLALLAEGSADHILFHLRRLAASAPATGMSVAG
jgi:hypothetical protein